MCCISVHFYSNQKSYKKYQFFASVLEPHWRPSTTVILHHSIIITLTPYLSQTTALEFCDKRYCYYTDEWNYTISDPEEGRVKCSAMGMWLLEIRDDIQWSDFVGLSANLSTKFVGSSNYFLLNINLTVFSEWVTVDEEVFTGASLINEALKLGPRGFVTLIRSGSGLNFTEVANKGPKYKIICQRNANIGCTEFNDTWSYNDYCYFKFETIQTRWQEALRICFTEKALMATFNNLTSNDLSAMTSIANFSDVTGYWVGVSKCKMVWCHENDRVIYNRFTNNYPYYVYSPSNLFLYVTSDQPMDVWFGEYSLSNTYTIVCMRDIG
ncbi:hypothetical protein HELRODRAFT_173703 [Helobdella robusta]|uniref:C-type lectin domain-containing protein n=1 Tax=Helobdella robusta TaxID=6412 RepID=T1F749_HELRO|nr:hypothetical protein HELRODRAFT_173703 [Helobdella robusta]ESO03406.1 hypothetical protein HELRODRAFT_173703 [Helobdella robusta]